MQAYSFCPVCAGCLDTKWLPDQEEPRLVCTSCGYIFYINSKPTANGVIFDDEGKLLLAKRGAPPNIGSWDFPGGFLENAEHPLPGLEREILEELGVGCTVGDLVAIHMGRFPGIARECTMNMYYEVTLKSHKVQALSDVAAVKWWNLSDLKPEIMSYDGAWKIVEYYLQKSTPSFEM